VLLGDVVISVVTKQFVRQGVNLPGDYGNIELVEDGEAVLHTLLCGSLIVFREGYACVYFPGLYLQMGIGGL